MWHEAFDAVIPDLARAFEPDLIFTQLGIDTHRNDPLAHLSLTTQGHNLAVQKFAALVNELDCPWISVGGGGYDMTAVARAWTMDLATMANLEIADEIPSCFTSLPNMPTFQDQGEYRIDPDIRNDIIRHNEAGIGEVKAARFSEIRGLKWTRYWLLNLPRWICALAQPYFPLNLIDRFPSLKDQQASQCLLHRQASRKTHIVPLSAVQY